MREKYGYISQHSHMLDGTVTDNLTLSKELDKQKVDHILDRLKLSHTKYTDPQRLPMGEQQRLNFGRVLYRDACNLLLCDEIFSNIDKDNRHMVAKALTDKFPTATVVLISHEDVPYRIDRILHVENTNVVEVEK